MSIYEIRQFPPPSYLLPFTSNAQPMKMILVATDFSAVADNALNYAIDMARAIHGGIELINVYTIPLSYASDVPLMLMSPDEMKKESEEHLKKVRERVLAATDGKMVVKYEARMGNPADELEKRCNELLPFAVVMGTTGKSALEKTFFGSTSLAVVRHLSHPVIVVPPARKFGDGVKRIGFACDFKAVADTIPVTAIREKVKDFNAELHILNVDYHDRHFKPDTPEELFYLHSSFADLKPAYHFINHRDVEDGILEFALENNLDLLIIIPKTHSLLGRIFKPASTKQLISQTFVPLLCIHSKTE